MEEKYGSNRRKTDRFMTDQRDGGGVMGYIRIPKEHCFCVYENERIDTEKLKLFAIGKVAVVKNDREKVTGIISFKDFYKGSENGNYPVNKKFRKIVFHAEYRKEVERFFEETEYQSIPVVNEDGELVECFIRTESERRQEWDQDKWIDISNPHLAKLVKNKGWEKITICITDVQSDQIYRYFKHYEFMFEKIEKVLWYNLLETGETDIVIVYYKTDMDVHAECYSFASLLMELEYRWLLHKCKEKNVRLYMVSIPTNHNVWNVTEEEKKRISVSEEKNWTEYLKNKELYSELLEQVLDRKDDLDEFTESCMDLPPVIVKGRLCYEREHTGKYVNVINGNRITTGTPDNTKNHIYLSGNSFLFGPLVDDEHTAASILQRMITGISDYEGYRVIHEGMRGAPFFESLKRLNQDYFIKDDIVVLFVSLEHLFSEMEDDMKKYLLHSIKIYHLEDVFNALNRKKVKSYFIESPVHPNALAYRLTAEYLMRIFEERSDDLWRDQYIISDDPVQDKGNVLDGSGGEWEEYLEVLEKYRYEGKGTRGAIVMNCNPLTCGHQYLIKYAAEKVDHLYIFIVQEDQSTYSFEERYEMARACTEGLSNITVIPSGRFIISAFTFPGYFTKQTAVPGTAIDTSTDIMIFGKYIAPVLNITVRFAGEEPTDFVTAQYNHSMKNILPEYGIRFVEIPRYAKKGMGIISAKKVREAIQKEEWARVRELVPDTTYQMLRRRHKG